MPALETEQEGQSLVFAPFHPGPPALRTGPPPPLTSGAAVRPADSRMHPTRSPARSCSWRAGSDVLRAHSLPAARNGQTPTSQERKPRLRGADLSKEGDSTLEVRCGGTGMAAAASGSISADALSGAVPPPQ